MRRILPATAALLASLLMIAPRRQAAVSLAAAAPQSSSPSSPEGKAPPKFVPPQILRTVDAAYPIKSVAFGTVVVEVHVAASGEIADVRVVRDIPSLTEQAVKAVKEWKFQPASLGGKPVASIVPVAFTFVRPDLVPRYGGQPKP